MPTNKYGRPFMCWAVDYLATLPTTTEGFRHCLVMVDTFSKWVEIIPMRSKASSEVWNRMFEVFCRFGLPVEIRCERGKEFAEAVTEGCRKFNITRSTIST